MSYTKQYIDDISDQTGFIANNIEKTLRLIDVLIYIFTKSTFKDALSLKGGTAINLIYTNLKRLSIDIDLDYHRYLDKYKASEDRKIIVSELDEYMEKEGYKISNKSRENAILTSRTYSYVTASGSNDSIKLDINFIDRISLYPTVTTSVNYFGKSVDIIAASKEELYGMKLSALINRSKARDLYDANYLFTNINDIDEKTLKKCLIFYLSLDGMYEINKIDYKSIRDIKFIAVRKELNPVLKRGEQFDLKNVQEKTIEKLIHILTLDENEKLYLLEFSKGNYVPSLLFDEEVANRAINHPMAKWRILNINKWFMKS